MGNRIFVKPALQATGEPFIVRHPHSLQPLKAEGESVEESSYWLRRSHQGDVFLSNEVSE